MLQVRFSHNSLSYNILHSDVSSAFLYYFGTDNSLLWCLSPNFTLYYSYVSAQEGACPHFGSCGRLETGDGTVKCMVPVSAYSIFFFSCTVKRCFT